MEYFAGIDIGGTNVKIGCFDQDINLVEKRSIPTDSHMGPENVVERVAEEFKNLLEANNISQSDLAGVGIGTPGPADYRKGILFSLANLPKFKDTPLRNLFSKALGCGGIMENDANVACWGEFSEGIGKDVNDMIFFTLGTGVGGGIIVEGELVDGSGGNGAELGHVILYPGGRACNCGQKGCVEAYASASSTAARAGDLLKEGKESTLQTIYKSDGEVTCKDVFDHAQAGDELALGVVEGTAEALALVSITMLHVTEPRQIVFTGGMIAAGDFLLDKIKHHFNENIWNLKEETVQLCFATLGEDTGIIGAASLAKHAKDNNRLA